MQRLSILISLVTLLALSSSALPVRAQSTGTPQLLVDTTLPDSRNDKFPSIAASQATVMIGGGVSRDGSGDNTNALVWTFAEQAATPGPGFDLGIASGQPDYSSVSLAATNNGVFYAVWGSIDERRVYLRRRDNAGNWGPLRIVTEGSFPIFPHVAVSSSGQVFAVWQDIDQPLFLKLSNDEGATFSNTFTTSEKTYSVPPQISAGPNGAVAVGFTTIDLNAAVAIWNGSGLSTELLTPTGVAADATTSFGPDGKIYAAWRGLEPSGGNSGVHYAERQGPNNWARVQLLQGEVKGAVNVVVDAGGTVHLGWIASISGSLRFYYARRVSGESQFSNAVATNSEGLFNSRLAVSSGGAFAHAALENFSGSAPFITYARFSGGPAVSPIAATPQIAGGDTMIRRMTSVEVSFLNVTGDPTEIRWRWGGAPTDSENDSNNWRTFANPLTITIPDAVLDAATCAPLQLFTQVRNSSQTTGQPQSAEVLVDSSVTAAVALTNPYMRNKAPQFSNLDATLGDYSRDGGASDGHPNYTRAPVVYVGVQGLQECSGIEDLATGRSTTTIAPALTVAKDNFSNVLPLPGAFQPGSNPVMLRVSDKVGNTRDYTQTLIFDTAPPLLSSSSSVLSAAPNPDATILTELTFTNVNVTDDRYPGRGFWGIWVANSRTAVQDPANSSSLIWFPVAAPGNGNTFTISDWSLASGLNAEDLTAGEYYIYVRFLDGAGNPTTGVLTATVNLTEVSFPKGYLPMVRR